MATNALATAPNVF